MHRFAIYLFAALSILIPSARAEPVAKEAGTPSAPNLADVASRLAAAYPDFVKGSDGNALLLNDATRLTVDDGEGAKSHATWLARPDLKDMFR